MRQACLPSKQPFSQECVIGPTLLVYSGSKLGCRVENLKPYTAYAFRVTSYNDQGKTESEWELGITSKSRDYMFSILKSL